MKRVVADAKALYARETVCGDGTKTTDAYLEMAVSSVLANKKLLTAAQKGKLQISTRPPSAGSC